MNLAETSQLLTLIRAYDNRKADDATVVAWHRVLGHLELADCQEAVVRHFGTDDAYLMPVHIRRLAADIDQARRRAHRLAQQEARAAEIAAIEADDPTRRDRSEAVRALIAELRDRLPDGDPDSLRYGHRYWREQREAREREKRAMPNPHYDPGALTRLADLEPPPPSTSEEP